MPLVLPDDDGGLRDFSAPEPLVEMPVKRLKFSPEKFLSCPNGSFERPKLALPPHSGLVAVAWAASRSWQTMSG